MRRAVKCDFLQALFVSVQDPVDAFTFWLEDVSRKSETVRRHFLRSLGQQAAKPIHWVLVAALIVLQGLDYATDHVRVLVLLVLRAEVVEGVLGLSIAVGKSEVDCQLELDLAPTEHVV